MNEKRLYQILLGPHTTEKSVRSAEKNRQIVFKVAKNATKTEVKQAVAQHFKVEVVAVQMGRIRGKLKRFKQIEGLRSGGKKAYVSLKEGQDINVANYQ